MICNAIILILCYFNSIKVRLEHVLVKADEDPTPTEFQFHKGAIRTTPILLTKSWLTYFNSIKVRLELDLHALYLLCRLFQFHKGAIRTRHNTAAN